MKAEKAADWVMIGVAAAQHFGVGWGLKILISDSPYGMDVVKEAGDGPGGVFFGRDG